MNSELVKISDDGNISKIEICDNIPILDYLEFSNDSILASIPLKVLFTDGYNFLTSTVLSQTIYICNKGDTIYYVADSKDKLRVIESNKGDEEIIEIILDMNKSDKTFRVTKAAHDLSLSTKYCVSYPLECDYIEGLTLERLEAFNLVINLIKRVGNIEELDKIANVYDLYKYTNIIDDEYFNPIISDDVITISKLFVYDDYDVNMERDQFFDIILNDTREKIGELTFTLYENNFKCSNDTIRYDGNVSYKIKDNYRSNHYATRALKLLIQLIKNNKCDTDKDLYISTLPDNINSQKVALNNGAVLYYEGEVPSQLELNYQDGVKEVKIYKIKI